MEYAAVKMRIPPRTRKHPELEAYDWYVTFHWIESHM